MSAIMDGKSGTTTYSGDGFLWYFVGSTSGTYKIGNKLKNQYLLNTTTTLTDNLGNFNSTGTSWTFSDFSFNQGAFLVSDGSKYWQNDKSGSYNYIHLKDLGSSPDDLYGWTFISYADLLDEAEANGMNRSTYEKGDPTASDFKTLVEAIKSKKDAASASTVADGVYLLRNRRFGYYLNTNDLVLEGASTPTQFTTWELKTVGGVRTLSSLGSADKGKVICVTNNDKPANSSPEAYWKLFNASGDQSFSILISRSSDGDTRYVKMPYSYTASSGRSDYKNVTLYFGMDRNHAATSTTSSGITSDWEFIPIRAYAGTIDNSIESEAELLAADENPQHTPYFRLRNVARSVSDYAEDVFDGGGYLEDVDHLHFARRAAETSAYSYDAAEAALMTTAQSADFYMAEPNLSHASALWEFVLIGRGATAGESATGLISPEHNIYALRNVNTGAYVAESVDAVGSAAEIKECTKKKDAAPFYLQKLTDGQYALVHYGGTTAGVDAADGVFGADQTADNHHAALTWNTSAAVNTHTAWIILPAKTLNVNLLNLGTNDGYDWSTLYYPFNISLSSDLPSGQNVELFYGGWQVQPSYNTDGSRNSWGIIEMNPVDDGVVPAGNAVIIRSNKNGDESFGTVPFNIAPPTEQTFAGNIWQGIVESEDDAESDFGDNWRSFWVLTKNKDSEVRLLHPAGTYLLPNRAYIPSAASERAGVPISSIKMLFPNGETTEIDNMRTSFLEPRTSDVIYSLDGRQIALSPEGGAGGGLPKGIYIVNGKKVVVK